METSSEVDSVGSGSESTQEQNYRGIIEVVVIVVVAVLVALIVRTFLLQLFYIPSASMDPTLKVNDKIFVNKLSYKIHDVNRGDIIVFDAPVAVRTEKIKDLVKRVVGLPGDSVEGRCPDSQKQCVVKIFINGKEFKEPYLETGIVYAPFEPISVPANAVFVMGDNRDDSEDGRFFGPISEDTIVGRAFFRLWPPSGAGLL